jgi:hypothetical protein
VTALQLAATVPVDFFFVTPPEQFPIFHPGTFTSKATKARPSTPISEVPSNVRYWVLELYPITVPEDEAPSAQLGSATVPSPSPMIAAPPVLHARPVSHSHQTACNCKGPCQTTSCGCVKANSWCFDDCHRKLGEELKDPAWRHKNCLHWDALRHR